MGRGYIIGWTNDGAIYCPNCAEKLSLDFDSDDVCPIWDYDEWPDYAPSCDICKTILEGHEDRIDENNRDEEVDENENDYDEKMDEDENGMDDEEMDDEENDLDDLGLDVETDDYGDDR